MLNMIDSDELQSIRDAANNAADRFVHDAPPDTDQVVSILTAILADVHFLATIASIALSREIRNGNDADTGREA